MINQEMQGYWDEIAKIQAKHFSENIWKKAKILGKILDADNFFNKRVLEIGVGVPLVSAAIQLILLNNWHWAGTDVSPIYVDYARKRMGCEVVHADVKTLPETEDGFDRIFCFDSLEHVPPDDREEGFERIGKVLAPHGRIYVHLPWEESHHTDFDYEFDLHTLALLVDKTETELIKYERYECETINDKIKKYKWVILER